MSHLLPDTQTTVTIMIHFFTESEWYYYKWYCWEVSSFLNPIYRIGVRLSHLVLFGFRALSVAVKRVTLKKIFLKYIVWVLDP